jgi:hypothetical protein
VHEHQLKGHPRQEIADKWQAAGDFATGRNVNYQGYQVLLGQLNGLSSASAWMLTIKATLDGKPFPATDRKTFERATSFLVRLARRAAETPSLDFPLPQMSPSPDGSIDLLWEKPGLELLVNIPSREHLPVSFDGEKSGQIRLTGETDIRHPADILLQWIQSP